MALSATSILSIVELALYLIVFPLTIYLGRRHGRHGLLGYFYLNLACAVRIVADIVSLVQAKNSATIPGMATVILGSIGLSPLMLALAGFLHEIHRYLLATTSTSHAQEKRTNRWLWFAQIQIHGVAATGMVLIILGGVGLASAKTTVDENKDNKFRSAGALLLLFLALALVQYAGWLVYQCQQISTRLSQSVVRLAQWTVVAAIIILVKVVYAVVYTFDHADSAINPITGTIAVKVVLVVGVQLLATLAMIGGGWASTDIAQVVAFQPVKGDAESGQYEGCRLMVQKV